MASSRMRRVRKPTPQQIDFGPEFGEVAALEDDEGGVATQEGVQQAVFSTAGTTDTAALTSMAPLATSNTDPTTSSETQYSQRTGFSYTWTSSSAASGPLASASLASSLSLLPSTSSFWSSSSLPSSSSSLVSTSSSALSLSSYSPSSTSIVAPTSFPSPSNSATPHLDHGALFYASVSLGVLSIIASIAGAVTYCIRIRRQAKRNPIAWDPVTIPQPEQKPDIVFVPDLTLAGDRDVGEPKRSNSTLAHAYEEQSYYSPHQIPPLADSAAYPLPPVAPHSDGPYLLPANGPTHTPSLSRSRISSRTGSIRSNLASASTLRVANPAPGAQQLRSDAEYDDYLDRPVGTPREIETRPRFMSLSGPGLDVPWRPEEDASRAQESEGWTQTLRASVLNAFQAVAGFGSEPEDHLTRLPSVARRERRQSVSRERREIGWARFAAEEVSVSDAASYLTAAQPDDPRFLAPPTVVLPRGSGPWSSSSGSSVASGMSIGSGSSQVPLIVKPRPAMTMSRESSVYSVASGMPPASGDTLRYLTGSRGS
ncbi:hypothetical protein HMN09_00203700 [Mycena chlorophos]|uniref:Transmembrane protein n=1 Tax=Mycena chlorophos TaxID=658473 RepID=A0A8H6TPV5_MYCCL|nr:hypothetical protein HMN09_00203700 [Mycena chlorophos]